MTRGIIQAIHALGSFKVNKEGARAQTNFS